jgi:hypothetical protein
MDARTSSMELLNGIHDPRGAKEKRHPLPALLMLAVAAMLAGKTTYEAIVQYGTDLFFSSYWGKSMTDLAQARFPR